MLRAVVAAVAAAALPSAAGATPPKALDPARGGVLREQPVTYTVRAKPGFSAPTAGDDLVAKHGLADPADTISLELARVFEKAWRTKLVTPPYVDGMDFQVNAAAEQAPYRIDVRTTRWGLAAVDPSHCGATYAATAALVERSTGDALAEATCSKEPAANGAPGCDELVADGAARLKQELQGAAASCVGQLKQQLFKPGTLEAAAAVAAAPPPAPPPAAASSAPAAAPVARPIPAPAPGPAPRPAVPPAVPVPPRAVAAAPKADTPWPVTPTVRWKGPASAVLSMGYDFGSSTRFGWVQLTDGSEQTLKANRGFWMSAGAAFLKLGVGPVGLETAATIGFKYSRIGVENDGIRYLAFPLEVVERASFGPLRLGVGASLALNPAVKGQGILAGPKYDLDLMNSLGVLFQLEFVGERARYRDVGWVVGVRYLWQKFGEQTLQIPADANSFGLALGVDL